jgi:alpha,alpha-trehalase
LSNVEVPEELETYIRRDTTHVETEQRPTQQEYDKYMAIVHFGKKVGWDNDTIYREGPFLMADPGIQFILLRATKDLLQLAKHLKLEAAFDEIQQWIDKLTQGSQWLWNDIVGGFCARDIRTGKFSDGITNASMLCFFANVGNAEQQEKMRAHCERILDKCNYGFPSWDPEHKSFDKIRYWRGPVWLVMNYMIGKGLLECGFDKLAHRIMNDTKMLVDKAGMAEYFDPIEGSPLGGQNFSWTAAIYLEMSSADVSEDTINRV